MLSFEEFKKMELVIARIKEVMDHPDADKLYVMTIEVGETEKQLVAGIRKAYTKNELIGREIVVVNNLEPAVIRGQESQGMLLAVRDEKGLSLLGPDRDVPTGSVAS